MARFILDVNTDGKEVTNQAVMHIVMNALSESVSSMTCVNQDNDTQFHEDEIKNRLTYDEIKVFNDNLHG